MEEGIDAFSVRLLPKLLSDRVPTLMMGCAGAVARRNA
jgi:hypothetical protein